MSKPANNSRPSDLGEFLSVSQSLRLRRATEEDAELLLEWRNDFRTRMASQNTAEVLREDHLHWIASSLRDKNRILMLAEDNGTPVGTVRADLKDEVCQLSWTVAPGARGRGIGKAMVTLFLSRFPGLVRAEVKQDNPASARIAERAGMRLVREKGGILLYERDDTATIREKGR